MRRALATTAAPFVLAAGIALGGAPLLAAPAYADTAVVAQEADTDTDEPLAEDGNDDTGKYGLIGLSGLFGLFGYKKYKEHRAATRTTTTTKPTTTPRTTGTSGPIGDVDGDGSGSRRV